MKAKKMKEIFLKREMKKCFFWQKPEGVILDDEYLGGTKKSYILAVCLEEEWLLYLSSFLRNMSYKWKKNFAQKAKSKKKFWRHF